MFRLGFAIVQLLVCGALLAACGDDDSGGSTGDGGSGKTFDGAAIEEELVNQGPIESADCPDEIHSEVGASFECDFDSEFFGAGTVEVTQTSDTNPFTNKPQFGFDFRVTEAEDLEGNEHLNGNFFLGD